MKVDTIPELGTHILIVMDLCESCLSNLRQMVATMPGATSRQFTLIHCIPAVYWEHGGDTGIEEARRIWQDDEKVFQNTGSYFKQAIETLTQGGVPRHYIHVVTDCESSDITQAVLKQLRTRPYTGVIVSSNHNDLVSLLSGRSIFRWFIRHTPDVTLWVVDKD